jgi:hypothetical protein
MAHPAEPQLVSTPAGAVRCAPCRGGCDCRCGEAPLAKAGPYARVQRLMHDVRHRAGWQGVAARPHDTCLDEAVALDTCRTPMARPTRGAKRCVPMSRRLLSAMCAALLLFALGANAALGGEVKGRGIK